MKEKLPVYLENRPLPKEKIKEKAQSYGYINIIYIISLVISLGSIFAVTFLRK